MLRTTSVINDEATTLRLEGKLCGPWVEEVQNCFDQAAGQTRVVHLDLGRVLFVDDAGASLLRRLLACGATVVACSSYVAELLRTEMES